MPDIRLVRRRGSQIWIWSGILAAIGLAVWAFATVFGDPTDPAEPRRVGAAAEFGAERAPVIPIEPVAFDSVAPLTDRDLGRLVRIEGAVESPIVRGVAWVRATDGRRIMVRVEPIPRDETVEVPFSRGGRIEVDGFLQSISRAEFLAWMDSLNVAVPRPPPAARFGMEPDPSFARIDAQFVRTYYVSVRPEQLRRERESDQAAARPASAPTAAPVDSDPRRS